VTNQTDKETADIQLDVASRMCELDIAEVGSEFLKSWGSIIRAAQLPAEAKTPKARENTKWTLHIYPEGGTAPLSWSPK
jgi:hypothetical protein